jgi:SAM-dependent methyltransferase
VFSVVKNQGDSLNLRYLTLRLIRHFLPEPITRFLLRRGWIIRPGMETRDPQGAVTRYRDSLAERGQSLTGKRVLVFGYGGNFAVGAELLKAGARHVTLLDRFAPPDNRRNRELLTAYPTYFRLENGQVRPVPEFITLIHDDVRNLVSTRNPVSPRNRVSDETFDVIVSTSVFEHLDDVQGLTAALAALTRPDGAHVHFVDLRDHYFKLPFEMLTFSERTWKAWLNPTSNLNRFRLRDYRRVFESLFDEVDIQILERDLPAFTKARPRLRPEFLTGDDEHDSVTLIRVVAQKPRTLEKQFS